LDGNGHNPTQKSATVTLVISFDQLTGAIGVNAPVQNIMLCYGMLEMARQAIQNYAAEAAKERRILPANVLPMMKPA
jgi:hypothetical protein